MRGFGLSTHFLATTASSLLVFITLFNCGRVSCQNPLETPLFDPQPSPRINRDVEQNATETLSASKGHSVHRRFGERIPYAMKNGTVIKEYYVIKNADLTSTEVPYGSKGKKSDIAVKKYAFPPFSATSTTTTTKAPRALTSRASKPTTRLTPPNNGQYVTMSRRTTTTTVRPTSSLTPTIETTEGPPFVTTTPSPSTTTEFRYISLKKTSRPVRVITKTFRPIVRTDPETTEEPFTDEPVTDFPTSGPSSAEAPSTTQRGIHYIITVIGGPTDSQKDPSVTEHSAAIVHEDDPTELESSTDTPVDTSSLTQESSVPSNESLVTTSTDDPIEEVLTTIKPFNPDDNLLTVEIPPSAITDYFRPGIFQSVEKNFRPHHHQHHHHHDHNRPEIIRTIPNYFENIGTLNPPYKTSAQVHAQLIPLQRVVDYEPSRNEGSNSGPRPEFRGREVSNQFRGEGSVFVEEREVGRSRNAVFSHGNEADKISNAGFSLTPNNDKLIRNPEFRAEESDRARGIIFRGRELNANSNDENSPFLTSKTVLYYTQVSGEGNEPRRVKASGGSPLNSIARPENRGGRGEGESVISVPVAARSFYLGTTQERLPTGSGFSRPGGSVVGNFIPN